MIRNMTDQHPRSSLHSGLLLLVVLVGGADVAAAHAQEGGGTKEEERVQEGEAVQAKALWKAAREGDLAAIQSLLDDGVDVNSPTQYGATALSYAVDRGHKEVVKLLLERGANPNSRDSFYGATPFTWALSDGDIELIRLLVDGGAEGIDSALLMSVNRKRTELVELFLESQQLSPRTLRFAWEAIETKDDDDAEVTKIKELLKAQAADDTEAIPKVDREQIERFTGTYVGDQVRYRLELQNDRLSLVQPSGARMVFLPINETEFEYLENHLTFSQDDEGTWEMEFRTTSETRQLKKQAADVVEAQTDSDPSDADSVDAMPTERRTGARQASATAEDLASSSPNWPSFRGSGARGIAEGQGAGSVWDAAIGINVLWKANVPGLGLSSPVIHGDNLFVTSAVSTEDQAGLRIGLYGDVDSVEDDSEHEFVLFCFSKSTGELKWKRTAHVGVPKVKRHLKSSHANPTCATDGRFVVASFGSEGLYCYDVDGNLTWRRDFGVLDSGWFYDPSYQWGYGSSPVIANGCVIIQCDIQEGSFLASLDLLTGDEKWRVSRDEIPTWSTPTVSTVLDQKVILTNGSRAARGYDFDTGELRWTFSGHSEIVVPTPFVAHGSAYITSGYSPIRPIYAVDPLAHGDLKPEASEKENASSEADERDDELVDPIASEAGIRWEKSRGGPYMPTPLVYGDYLYTCGNNGVVACYDALTGEQIYQERCPDRSATSFVASPVAADGKLYLTSEEGRVVVLRAGPEFEWICSNDLGTVNLASPAISDGVMFFRCENELIAVKTQRPPRPPIEDEE